MAYPGTMRLAFEKALRDAGIAVPADVRGPLKTTATWSGSRDGNVNAPA